MDINITLKEGREALHGPEVSNNLPSGVAVKYQVQLAQAIKDAVVDATKAKNIKKGLSSAKWTFAGNISDGMDKEPPKDVVGRHTLKFKFAGSNLAKTTRCIVAGAKSKGPDPAAKANAKAVKQATSELVSLAKKYPDLFKIKVGDKHHAKNVIYSIQIGPDKRTASIPHHEDTHVKETSRIRALGDWKKNRTEFVAYQREQAKSG